jgi:hypothetical protein
MPRKTALFLSGIITAFILMVVVGLVYGANRYGAAAAAPANPAAVAAALASDTAAPAQLANNSGTGAAASAADVAALQAQVQQYKQQLQQAYSDLQQAYDQIQTMNNTLSQGQGGGRRFRGEGGNEQQQPGSQGIFGGSDD